MFYNSKYNSKKCIYDGITFDSKLECNIYKEIKNLNIKCLIKQKYVLQEKFRFESKIYREITYTDDFELFINDKKYVIDVKGLETTEFKIKKKLFIYKYNQDIILIKSVKQFKEWYYNVTNNIIL